MPCWIRRQVTSSGRIGSATAREALSGQIDTALTELASKTAKLDNSGKLKMPKKKKVLTPVQEADKLVDKAVKKSPACMLRLVRCQVQFLSS